MPSLKDHSQITRNPLTRIRNTAVLFFYDILDYLPSMTSLSKDHIMFVGLSGVSDSRKADFEAKLADNALMLKPLTELAIDPMTRAIFVGRQDDNRFGIVSSNSEDGKLSLRQRLYLRQRREEIHDLSGWAGYILSASTSGLPQPHREVMTLLADKNVSFAGSEKCLL